MKHAISRGIVAGVASLALATGTAAVMPGIAEAASCRLVTAQSLTLWNAPSGGADVGTWTYGHPFTEYGIEGSNRYRTATGSGATVWVTADPQWSMPCM